MANEKFEALSGREYPDTLEEQLKTLETDDSLEEFQKARERLAADPYRPLYHFSPPDNRMNDPNGLCFWQGRYHLFYQYEPAGRDRIHWGHAVSEDLIRWRDLPIALYPDRERDCYSGQTLVEDDRVIAIYHGTRAGNALATASDPLLLNWKKHPDNPVIPIVPVDESGVPYRVFDPCIWREEDGYYSLSGVYWEGERRIDCRGVAHVFRSRDLARWEHLGPLIEAGLDTEPGEDYAVPNFWPIGSGKHMLLFFSHKRGGQYYVGAYDKSAHRLIPELHGRMNYGPISVGSLHAPSATIDQDGRYLGIFNVKEGKQPRGWEDIMTLPRVYSLGSDDSLRVVPVPEIESLRCDAQTVEPAEIPANSEVTLEQVSGRALELEAVIDPGAAREVGLYVLRSPDGVERTRISLFRRLEGQRSGGALQIDVSEASLSSEVYSRTPETGPFDLAKGETLALRIFVDRSIVEVFAGNRQSLTVRAYPDRPDSSSVSLFARGGRARLLSLKAWRMNSIWPELEEG